MPRNLKEVVRSVASGQALRVQCILSLSNKLRLIPKNNIFIGFILMFSTMSDSQCVKSPGFQCICKGQVKAIKIQPLFGPSRKIFSELRDRDDIPLLLEGKRSFRLVWMESISPHAAL